MPTVSPIYGPGEFQHEFGVSSEIRARLEIYTDLLIKWQPRINLVGNSTLPDLWGRHMRDSAQLLEYMQDISGPWLDIGSGAGFPGLVLAITNPSHQALPVHLIESDQRKVVFLREVIRLTQAPARAHSVRVEQLKPAQFGGKAGLITARAIAPLHQLFDLTESVTGPLTIFILLKGQDIDDELTLAAKYRRMQVSQYPSRTNPAATVLRITEVARV